MHDHYQDPNNIIFEALEARNVVEEDHKIALALQHDLNNADFPIEAKMKKASEIIAKLDAECSHNGKEIKVSGTILTKEIDLKGIDFVNKGEVVVEPAAFQSMDRKVEDCYAVSRGYVGLYTPSDEQFIFYQIIDIEFYAINIPGHGTSVVQSGTGYVPLDRTAHVDLIDSEVTNMPNEVMLDVYIPDVIDAIDEIIENANSQEDDITNTLRNLSKLDLSVLNKDLFTAPYAEIKDHLSSYISALIDYKQNTPYYIEGVKEVRVMSEKTSTTLTLQEGTLVPGYINSIVVDESSQNFAIEMAMPFSDGSVRIVRYPLNSTIDVNALATLPAPDEQ